MTLKSAVQPAVSDAYTNERFLDVSCFPTRSTHDTVAAAPMTVSLVKPDDVTFSTKIKCGDFTSLFPSEGP